MICLCNWKIYTNSISHLYCKLATLLWTFQFAGCVHRFNQFELLVHGLRYEKPSRPIVNIVDIMFPGPFPLIPSARTLERMVLSSESRTSTCIPMPWLVCMKPPVRGSNSCVLYLPATNANTWSHTPMRYTDPSRICSVNLWQYSDFIRTFLLSPRNDSNL